MLSKYYLNDYFPLIDSPLLKEREYMKTDIREEVNKYIMEIDLPGLKKEDILINYENGYLTIKAVKKVELKTEVYVRRERFYGEVKRSFYIGEYKIIRVKSMVFEKRTYNYWWKKRIRYKSQLRKWYFNYIFS